MSLRPRKILTANSYLTEIEEKPVDKKKVLSIMKPILDRANIVYGAYEFGQRLKEAKEEENKINRRLSGVDQTIPYMDIPEKPSANISDVVPGEKDLRELVPKLRSETLKNVKFNKDITIPEKKESSLKNIKIPYGGLTNPIDISKKEEKDISDINWDIYDKLAGINRTGELGSGNPLFDIPRWITSTILKTVTPETFKERQEKSETGKYSIGEKKQRQDLMKYFENVENGKESANILQQTLGKTSTGFITTITGTIKGLDTFSQNLANILTGGEYKPDYNNTAVQLGLNKVNEVITDWLSPTDKRYNIVGDVAQGIGSSLGFLATGKILPVFKNPTYNIMLTGALSNGQSAFEETYRKTGDINAAINSFYVNAAMGTTEALPLANFLDRIKVLRGLTKDKIAKQILKSGSKQFIEEGAQEFGQQLLQDIESMNYDKNKTIEDSFSEALYQGLVGGLSGFLMTGMGSIPGGYRIKTSKVDVKNPEKMLENAIVEKVQEPEKQIEEFKKEVKEVAVADAEAVKNLKEEPEKTVTVKQPYEMRQVEVSSKKAEKIFPLNTKVEIKNDKPIYTYSTTVLYDGKERTFQIESKSQPNATIMTQRLHKKIVETALSEGKTVPPEVLKDYDDLRDAEELIYNIRNDGDMIEKYQKALDSGKLKEKGFREYTDEINGIKDNIILQKKRLKKLLPKAEILKDFSEPVNKQKSVKVKEEPIVTEEKIKEKKGKKPYKMTLEEYTSGVYDGKIDFQNLGMDAGNIQSEIKNYNETTDEQNKKIAKDWIDKRIRTHYHAEILDAFKNKLITKKQAERFLPNLFIKKEIKEEKPVIAEKTEKDLTELLDDKSLKKKKNALNVIESKKNVIEHLKKYGDEPWALKTAELMQAGIDKKTEKNPELKNYTVQKTTDDFFYIEDPDGKPVRNEKTRRTLKFISEDNARKHIEKLQEEKTEAVKSEKPVKDLTSMVTKPVAVKPESEKVTKIDESIPNKFYYMNIPAFDNYIKEKSTEYGSKVDFLASEEFKKVKPIYDELLEENLNQINQIRNRKDLTRDEKEEIINDASRQLDLHMAKYRDIEKNLPKHKIFKGKGPFQKHKYYGMILAGEYKGLVSRNGAVKADGVPHQLARTIWEQKRDKAMQESEEKVKKSGGKEEGKYSESYKEFYNKQIDGIIKLSEDNDIKLKEFNNISQEIDSLNKGGKINNETIIDLNNRISDEVNKLKTEKKKPIVADSQNKKGKVLYHGTAEDFENFDIEKSGSIQTSDWGKGIYFTRYKSDADYYRIEAVKKSDKKYNELYEKYNEIARKLPNTSEVDETPKYNEESRKALKDFQNYARELTSTTKKGKIITVELMPDAKIMKHTAGDITDPFLSEYAKEKGYDAILVDENKMMEEYLVINLNKIRIVENKSQKEIEGNQNEQKPRSSEIIESEVKAIESEEKSNKSGKNITKRIEKVNDLIDEIDDKLKLLGYYDSKGSTEKEVTENGNLLPEKKFKKDLTNFSKRLASILGWEHDTNKKGKPIYADTNVAPVGGDGTFILWKPDSELGVYVDVSVDREDNYDYENDIDNGSELRIRGIVNDIMWRITNKKDKYTGYSNQWANKDITVGELAKLVKKDLAFYEEKEPDNQKEQIEKLYDKEIKKFEAAKTEIDNYAESIKAQDKTKGVLFIIKPGLKSKDRTVEKTIYEARGNFDVITDIARNTIIVNSLDDIDSVLSRIEKDYGKENIIKFLNISRTPSQTGYRGALVVIRTKNGKPAEIQVNTPEITLAKGPNLKNYKEEAVFTDIVINANKILNSTDIPIGLGHLYYEAIREVDLLVEQNREAGKEDKELIKILKDITGESKKYYDLFDALLAARLNVSSDISSPISLAREMFNDLDVESVINELDEISNTSELPPGLSSILTRLLKSLRQYDTLESISNISKKSLISQEKKATEINKKVTEKYQEQLNNILRDAADKYEASFVGTPKSVRSIISKLSRHERAGRDTNIIKDAVRGLIIAEIKDFPGIIKDLQKQGFKAEINIDKPYNDFGYRSIFLQKDFGDGIGGLVQLLTEESDKIKLESDKLYRKWRDKTEAEIKQNPDEFKEYSKDKEKSNKLWTDFWDNVNEDIKNEIKGKKSQIKEKISEIDKSLDDAWGDLLNTAKDKKIFSGVPVDPEILTKSINIARLYVQKGVYKFADICLDAYKRLGKDTFEKFFESLKSAYGSLHTSDLSDEIIDNLDGTGIVRKISLENALDNINNYYVNLSEKENTNADNKRNNGESGSADELSDTGGSEGDSNNSLEETQEESVEGISGTGGTGRKGKRSSGKNIPSISRGTKKNNRQQGNGGTTGEEHGMGQSEGTVDNAGGTGETGKLETTIPVDYTLKPESTSTEKTTFSKRKKAIANVKAIETVNNILREGRLANKEEQDILAQYVGWGGIPEIFDENKEDWSELRNQLKDLISSAEYDSARASTKNAHYTSPELIKAIYNAIEKLGFKGGRILEPSAGIGHFFMLMPEAMKKASKLHGIELDYYTGAIAKQLTQTGIWDIRGYEDVKQYDDGYFDLIISNVPFGNYKVFDPNIPNKLKNKIHNYFFAKSLKKVRDGGIIAFITSKGTLDSFDNSELRSLIGKESKFLGAVRLPNNAFLKNANTKVVTDVIFLQKNINANNTSRNPDLGVSKKTIDEKEFYINNYFLKNPEMVIGDFIAPVSGGLYGGNELTVEYKGNNFEKDLEKALNELKKDTYRDIDESMKVPEYSEKEHSIEIGKYADGQFIIETTENNIQIFQVRNGGIEKVEFGDSNQAKAKKDKTLKQIKMIELARDIMITQSTSDNDALYKDNLKLLNEIYDEYVSKYGFLNSKENKKILFSNFYGDDPYRAFLLSLENYDDNTNTATKSDRFLKRTASPVKSDFNIENVKDALIVSQNIRGKMDIDMISRITKKPYQEVISELKKDNLAFFDGEKYIYTDEYLSGNVKKKLKKAKYLLEKTGDNEYRRNIQELEKVIPIDLTPADIRVNLGCEWIGAKSYNEFLKDLLGLEDTDIGDNGVNVIFNEYKKDWTIKGADNFKGNAKNIIEYGTEDANAIELLNLLLNNKKATVYEYDKSQDRNVLNEPKTFAAQAKQDIIKDEFNNWIYRDEKRAFNLAEIYNERFNNIAERKFDGSHLSLPGLNREIADRLFPHVKDAVWRITQQRDVLLAHKVGLGKTWSMSIGAMELKRLGLAKKPLHIVKNTMVRQYANEFFMLYPNAKILVIYPDEIKGNAKLKRQIFLSKIANNEWDSIIIPNTFFTKLPISPDVERAFLEEQVAELEAIIREEENSQKAEGTRGKSRTVKQLETIKENFEVKIKALLEKQKNKDLTVYYEDLGVDQLFVDEAHNYKNLFYVSRMQMRGLNRTNSVRALDLFLKTKILREKYKSGLVFATGTPIGNTIAEMFTMMRYLQPHILKEYGIDHFDSWVNDFGKIMNDYEVNVLGTGIQKVQRVKRYTNVRELSLMFRQNADVKGFDDGLGESSKPSLITGKHIEMIAPKNEYIEAYLKYLASRYENCLKGEDPKIDNVLKVMTDGRKAAIDLRLVGIDVDYPQSKINISIPQIYEDWKHTEKEKGVILCYMSMGTPSGVRSYSKQIEELNVLKSYISGIKHKNLIDIQSDIYKKLTSAEKEADLKDLTIKERIIDAISRGKITKQEVINAINDEIMIYENSQNEVSNINLYADIKKKLIKKGIPQEDIVFAQDFKTSVQRQQLYDGMNTGKYRVVLGTKELLGEGVNAQRRLYAEFIFDPPHRPMDLEQMIGRMIRNGNMFKKVKLYFMSSEGSFDTFMWGQLERKSGFISQVMNNNINIREIEDIDEKTLSYAEMSALTSGNKEIIELQKYRDEYTRLYHEFKGFMDNQYKIIQKQKALPEYINEKKKITEYLKAYISPIEEYNLDNFDITVTGEKFEKPNIEEENRLRAERQTKKQELKDLLLDYKDEESGKIKQFSKEDQVKYDKLNTEIKGIETSISRSPRARANKKIAEITLNLIKGKYPEDEKQNYIIGKYKNYDIHLSFKKFKSNEKFYKGEELVEKGQDMIFFDISLIQKIDPDTGKETYKIISGNENEPRKINYKYSTNGSHNAIYEENSMVIVKNHLQQDIESGAHIVNKLGKAGETFNLDLNYIEDGIKRAERDYNAVKDYQKKEFPKIERVKELEYEIERIEKALKVDEEIKQKTGNEGNEDNVVNEENLAETVNELENQDVDETEPETTVEGVKNEEEIDKERQLEELENELKKNSESKRFKEIVKSPYYVTHKNPYFEKDFIHVPDARTLKVKEFPDLELFIHKVPKKIGKKTETSYIISEANTGLRLTETENYKSATKSVINTIEAQGGINNFKKVIENYIKEKGYKTPYYEENNAYKDIKVNNEKAEENDKRKKVLEYLLGSESYSVGEMAENTGVDNKEANRILSDLYKADKLKRDGTGKYIPTDDYLALVTDMQQNPHKYGTTLDKLYSNPVGEVLKGIGEGINFLDDVWEKFIGDKLWDFITHATDITSKKILGEKIQEKVKELIITNYGLPEEYLGKKREVMVMADYYKDLAKDIAEKLVMKDGGGKYSKAEQIRLGQIIKGGITSDPNLRKKADEVRGILKELHEKGKKLEVLPIETYNEKLPRKRIHELLTWKAKYQAKLNKLIHESKGSIAADVEVNALKSKIVNIDNKVKTSYKLGGTGYFKRVYASKEGGQNMEELMKKYGYIAEDGSDGNLITREDILLQIPEIMDNDLKRKQNTINEIEEKKNELNDKLAKLGKSQAKDAKYNFDKTLEKIQKLEDKLKTIQESIDNRLPVQEMSYKKARRLMLRGPGKSNISLKNFFDAISNHPVFASETEQRGYVLMPKDPRFGALAGKYVERSIASDIQGDFKQNIDRLTEGKRKLPTRLDLTSAIHRQDIPLSVRMELGEILTASYPTAKAIMLEGMDVSLGNLFKYIGEHPEYVSDEERPDFVKMPDRDLRLGLLQGKYVDPRIAGDIEDMLEFADEHFVDKFIKKLTAVWKATKTVMNPATHMRNIMSASVFVDYAGINHVKQAAYMKDAFMTLLGKGEYAADFKASGLKGTTFNSAELERFLGIMKEMDFKTSFKEGWENFLGLGIADKIIKVYGKVSLVDSKYGEMMRNLYQNEDMFWKAMIFVDRRNKGYSIIEAREDANKWMFDYSEVPKLIEKLRSGSFLLGMPFISWTWKAMPRVAEASIKRPLTFWKYPLLFSLLTAASLKYLNISDDEWEKIKTTLPDRLKKGQWILLPMRDDNGNLELLDITYIVPYKDWYDVIQSGAVLASTGQLNSGDDIIEGIAGMANNPIFTAVTELSSNKNRFLNRTIWNETDKPGQKMQKALDYMYKLWMPSLHPEIPGLTRGGYAYDKLASAIFQRPDYQNRVFSLAPVIGSTMLGLKTIPIEEEKFKDQHISKLRGEILELNRVKGQILKDDSIDKADRLKKAAEYDLRIQGVEDSIKMYEKDLNIANETFEGKLLDRTIRRLQKKENEVEGNKKEQIRAKINELKIDLDKIRQSKYGSKEDISNIKKNVILGYDFKNELKKTSELKNTKSNISKYINSGKEDEAEEEIKFLIEVSKNSDVPKDIKTDINDFFKFDFKYWMQDKIYDANDDLADKKITKEQADKRKEIAKKLYNKYKNQ